MRGMAINSCLQFTQLDIEMSFTGQEGIMNLAEQLVFHVFDKVSEAHHCH